MRYEGQEHTVAVPLPAGRLTIETRAEIAESFQTNYEREYTYRLGNAVELVSYHLAAFAAVKQPQPPRLEQGDGQESTALKGRRRVDFDEEGIHMAAVYGQPLLGAMAEIRGPAKGPTASRCCPRATDCAWTNTAISISRSNADSVPLSAPNEVER